jgi:Ca2+-binding EF-hand superfamily protein
MKRFRREAEFVKYAMKICLSLAVATCLLMSGTVLAQTSSREPHRSYDPAYRLEQFDLNHDGKITHDELNRTIAMRFSTATHGAKAMTLDQFVSSRMGDAQQRIAQAFRRLDWNGDGKLSFDEYAGPQRARFQYLDRDGKGSEPCAADGVQRTAYRPDHIQRNNFGHVRFCAENDLNHDGMVTHAEFDAVEARRFSSVTGGAKTMTQAQFAADTLARYRQSDARIFGYLDRDHDGQLSLAEFAASDEKLFARLDRNDDGTLTREEMSSAGSDFSHRSRNAY